MTMKKDALVILLFLGQNMDFGSIVSYELHY